MAFALSNNENTHLITTINEIKQNLLDVDKWLTSLRSALESGEWVESRIGAGKCRMRLSESLQKIDKLSVNINNAERVESIGFRPLTLNGAGRKDFAKGNSNSLIHRILQGEANVVDIAKETHP